MGLVIDTNVFIDAQNGRFALKRLADFAHYGEGYIAAITVSELLAGVHLAATAAQRVQRSAFVEGLIGSMPVLDFTEAVARKPEETGDGPRFPAIIGSRVIRCVRSWI